MSRSARVLIVDDEPDIETLIRRRFQHANGDFEFVFARNGREALDVLAADPAIGVVVTDLNMPVMDGLALLARLNALEDRVLKAVILSAYGDMANIRAAMNRGAFDFLTKPIDFRDFDTTLRRTSEALEASRQDMDARVRLAAIEQELDIAARIQASMLPREFLPGRSDFGVYAEMAPARRVGGDFYDFFLIDERRLGFLIGDVSGKGIPAALYMAVCRTLLQAVALQGLSPAECLQYANRVLGRQGEAVYVTVFYGILDTHTGEVSFCLGGHNPPYRLCRGGELQPIADPGGVVIGLLPDSTYETGHLRLDRGDKIFLFTDGVTEAMNAGENFFGERRLRDVLSACGSLGPEATVKEVLAAVSRFTSAAPQSDDITAMTVQW